MAFNPYTPPAAGSGDPYGPGMQPTGGPMEWEPTEVAGRAWDVVKMHFWPLVGAYFVVYIIQAIVQNIIGRIVGMFIGAVDPMQFQSIRNVDELMGLYQSLLVSTYISIAITLPVQAFFKVGLCKLWLGTSRGSVPNFGDIFSGGSRTLSMLAVLVVKMIAVSVGLMLFIFPGVWIALALSQAEFFVVDRNMGAIEAMKASVSATEGQKGKLFLYGIIAFFIICLGFLACCVGFFVAYPVVGIAGAIIFTRLTGTAGPPPGTFPGYGPMGPMGGPPPGYGGPPPGYGGPPPGYGPPGGGFGGPPGGGFGGPPGGGPPPGYGPPGGGPPPGYGPPGGGYGPGGGRPY